MGERVRGRGSGAYTVARGEIWYLHGEATVLCGEWVWGAAVMVGV